MNKPKTKSIEIKSDKNKEFVEPNSTIIINVGGKTFYITIRDDVEGVIIKKKPVEKKTLLKVQPHFQNAISVE